MSIEAVLEQKVIERFIVKDRHERFLTLLANPKNRKKLTLNLSHFSRFFNQQLFTELFKNEEQAIREKIAEKGGFKDCYLMSESDELDAKRLKVEEAIEAVVGRNIGTLIIFGNAQIVYYEGESPKDRWLSK